MQNTIDKNRTQNFPRYKFLFFIFATVLLFSACEGEKKDKASVIIEVEGEEVPIDEESGLVAQGDYMIVKGQCTACHSGKLVTQNRATREGWEEMIRWMQKTQKLWDLGEQEEIILDYLATYYSPEEEGRRRNLEVDEWYEIE